MDRRQRVVVGLSVWRRFLREFGFKILSLWRRSIQPTFAYVRGIPRLVGPRLVAGVDSWVALGMRTSDRSLLRVATWVAVFLESRGGPRRSLTFDSSG